VHRSPTLSSRQSPATAAKRAYAPPISAPGAKPFGILGAGTATAAQQVELGPR
jgi:hypothetical protein